MACIERKKNDLFAMAPKQCLFLSLCHSIFTQYRNLTLRFEQVNVHVIANK